jgi:cytochrome P450
VAVDYDPYSHEAMTEPRPLYARLRAEDPVHYLEQYDTWALATFDTVWQVCGDTTNFTCTRGQTPNQVMLGDPTGHTFPELDPPEHRLRRRVLSLGYTRDMASHDEPHVREIARSVLTPLVAGGARTMDAYADYASRVTARFAAEKAGLPSEDGERIRHRMDDMFTREPDQRGSSDANIAAAMEVFEYLYGLVATTREEPGDSSGLLRVLLDAEIDGIPLTDEQIAAELHTVMITGSETTELGVAATLHYLAENRDQLAAVRADRSLVPHAFSEAVRCDHPTNILCRAVTSDVEVGGKLLRAGQGVLLLWGSANLDESEFPNASAYDLHRRYERSLLFGHGQHKCLGEHLAVRMGTAILDELFEAIGPYEIDTDNCHRLYGEFLKGFDALPIRFEPAGS